MRIDPRCVDEARVFLRAYLQRPDLELPAMHVHCGPLARLIVRLLGSQGTTIGTHIFTRPSLCEWNGDGRVRLPTRFLVHEATHVLQYRERGVVPFLVSYVGAYLSAICAEEGLRGIGLGMQRLVLRRHSAARLAAYLAIPFERLAYAAEFSYSAEHAEEAESERV